MARDSRTAIVSCDGGSPASRRAAAVAEELASRGLGRRADAAATLRERRVLVLDGCSSACCSRGLTRRGVEPDAVVDLGRLQPPTADAVAALVGCATREPAAPRRSPAAPPPPAPASPDPGPHTVDDYLLALDSLAAPVVECGALVDEEPTLAAHVSRVLGVARPTAGEMLARMGAAGLVRRDRSKQILLTANGRAAADRAVRAHRLLERFATDVLGYPLWGAFARARALAPGFDEDATARLADTLGEPVRCPHGWLVDARRARKEGRSLRTLTTLAAGEGAQVVCLDERDPAALREAVAAGLLPGVAVERPRRARSDAAFAVGGHAVSVSAATAARILVDSA